MHAMFVNEFISYQVTDTIDAIHQLERVLGIQLQGYIPGTVSVREPHKLNEVALKKYLREKIKLKSDGLLY